MFDIATMNLEEINRRLFEIPKVELHCHLELAFRPSTLREWAIEDGLEVKSDEDFEREFLILEPMDDLPTVLNKFLQTRDRLSSLLRIERLAFEACEDMYQKSNVRLLELRYAPSFTLEVFPRSWSRRFTRGDNERLPKGGDDVSYGCWTYLFTTKNKDT